VKGKDRDIFQPVHKAYFMNGNKGFVNKCKKIYNEIANNYYSLEDLAMFALYQYLMKDKQTIFEINQENVLKFKKLLTSKQLNNDKEIIRSVNEKLKLKENEYFEIREDGTSIICSLTKKGLISPAFSVNFYKKVLTNYKENVIFKDKKIKEFVRIIAKIREILIRRSSNAEEKV